MSLKALFNLSIELKGMLGKSWNHPTGFDYHSIELPASSPEPENRESTLVDETPVVHKKFIRLLQLIASEITRGLRRQPHERHSSAFVIDECYILCNRSAAPVRTLFYLPLVPPEYYCSSLSGIW